MPIFIRKDSISEPTATTSVCITEGDFTVKNFEDANAKHQAYQLRHNIFCQELSWVLMTEKGLEIDIYDKHAIFFGVFDGQQKLLAFLRLILPEVSFMMENEFSCLVGTNYRLRKEIDTAEISRLCVAAEARKDKASGNFGLHFLSMLLFKGTYQWCTKNNIRHLYAVTEYKIFKLFCIKGFPCKLIGDPQVMPDGVLAVAFIIDLKELDAANTSGRKELINWLRLV